MAEKCKSKNYVADVCKELMSRATFGTLRNIIRAATYAQICGMQHIWAHVRRDFIKCAAGNRGAGGLGAALDRAHRAALPVERGAARALRRRSRPRWPEPRVRGGAPRTGTRVRAVVRGGATGTRRPPGRRPRGQPPRSLLNHREGLSVFLDQPDVPMDNNFSERMLRGAAIGRRLSFGSDSEAGARFTATMYSAVGTLELNGVDVLRWLAAWLSACADNGGRRAGRPLALAALVDGRGAPERVDRAGMTGAVECRYHGRDFTPGEMALLRALIAADPPCPVEGVLPARRLVQARRRAQGHDGPRHHAGHAQGWPDRPAAAEVAAEPAPAHRLRAGHRTAAVPAADNARRGSPARPAHRRARHPRGQAVERVRRPPSLSRLQDLVGARMRYAVHDRDGSPLAMLGFSTAAWRLAPRDDFIGWTPQLREKNLPLVVDNPRFLIPPWIEIPNLGSHLLAIVRRRLPEDWAVRYNTKPVLIETFVETPRYTGAVYRASGWVHVGTTRGRGRYDRQRQFDKPRKDIRLRPLRKDWKRVLNR